MNMITKYFQRPPRVAVIRLAGVIGSGPRAALSDEALAPLIERAFRRGKPAAVALVINSPGGSPVQSALIGSRIRRLADEKKIPVHAFVEDVAASGGYWLACAADDIYVDAASIVGSIGVISAGFGAHELLARQGVERRVYTAGTSKSMLDPFRPENPDDVARLKGILTDMHGIFIGWVKSRRGAKLADQDLFTGEIWLGEKAQALGLVDGIATLEPWLKARYGDKVRLMRLSRKRGWMPRIGLSLGLGLAEDALSAVEDRAHWARFGL
jgi:serine protease SohB